ncbi:hypothetical protein B0H13DRAFT_1907390 [Mycena leptocephala]|nr:hypothetical protein B0H13DRAFT_1907390 [Mycena leptocephala]
MNTHTHTHTRTKKPKRKLERKRGKQRSVERKRGSKRGHPGKETKETHTRRNAKRGKELVTVRPGLEVASSACVVLDYREGKQRQGGGRARSQSGTRGFIRASLLGRGRGGAGPKLEREVAERAASRWVREIESGRESGDSEEQTQTQRIEKGRGMRAAHPRGREGAAEGRKDGMRKRVLPHLPIWEARREYGWCKQRRNERWEGPGSRAEGGGAKPDTRRPKPEMVPCIGDASKWVRGIGCEPAERGAERRGRERSSPNVELETRGGARRRPAGRDGAPGDDPTVREAWARWVAGEQDRHWVGSEARSARISDVGHTARREHVGAGEVILGVSRRSMVPKMEDGKGGAMYAESTRTVSRTLLLKLLVRERGERKGRGGGSESRKGDSEEMGSSSRRTRTYASWAGLVLYRPPSLPTTMTRIWRKEQPDAEEGGREREEL